MSGAKGASSGVTSGAAVHLHQNSPRKANLRKATQQLRNSSWPE